MSIIEGLARLPWWVLHSATAVAILSYTLSVFCVGALYERSRRKK